MKKVQKEVLKEKSKDELISDLRSMKYSILDSIGYKTSKLKMFIPRFFATIVVLLLFRKSWGKTHDEWVQIVRKRIIKLFNWGVPYEIYHDDELPKNLDGLVIGFNHPSLGEILRLIALVCKYYPNNKFLFPVTLPWYEAFCPVINRMEDAGIYLTPIVTPSTREKIEKDCDKEAVRIMTSITSSFNTVYMNLCRKFAREKEIILVAPPATRQAYIFKTDAEIMKKKRIEPQTMSLISSTITRELKDRNITYLPIAAIPPKEYKRGINMFSKYIFGICSTYTSRDVNELSKEKYGEFNGREFDYDFLARISKMAFQMGRYDIIAPFIVDKSMDYLAKILEISY